MEYQTIGFYHLSWRDPMRKTVVIVIAALVFVAPAVVANPNSAMVYGYYIEVIPAEPGPEDIVILKTHGVMPDGCWSFEASSVVQNGNTFEVTDWILHNTDMELCPMIVIEYTSYDTIGQLRPGTYTANATEIEHYGPPVVTGHASIEFTVSGCDCAGLGDCDGNLAINPVDAVYMVNNIYRGRPLPEDIPTCAVPNGDWNCDGLVNPVDMVEIVNYVYHPMMPPPCDPCRGGPLPDLYLSSNDMYVSGGQPIETGVEVWLGIRVYNIGRDTAFAPWLQIYQGNPQSGGILLGEGEAGPLPPGQNTGFYGGLFSFDSPGVIEIYGVADRTNAIVEIYEDNNQGHLSLEIIQSGFGRVAPGASVPPVVQLQRQD